MTAFSGGSADQPLHRALDDLLEAEGAARAQIHDQVVAQLDAIRVSVDAVAKAAQLDHKTPLFNERALDIVANEFPADLTQHWVVFAGDVDDFKQLNSMFPYKEVDIVLREIGTRLLSLAQAMGGRGFRRGGDEFVLVVPQAATSAATQLAAIFESLPVELPSTEDPEQVHRVQVRVSFGSAVVARDATFYDSLARAEKACKTAKWMPDRVVVDADEQLSSGWSARPRCPTCRTQVIINGAPECPRPPSVRCPCGVELVVVAD